VILTPRRVRSPLGPVLVSLAAGVVVLLFGVLVNGCRINQLLGRSNPGGPGGTDSPLNVTPAVVRDSALAGSTAPRQTSLQVMHSASWSATNDSPWIGLNPTSGSGPRALTITLDPQRLQPGPHDGAVTVSAPEAVGSPVTIPVSFVILQPILVVHPAGINHTARSGHSQFFDTLEVGNDGTGPLVWTASNTSTWLRLGAVAGVGPGKIPMRMSSAGLAVGLYKDTVLVVAVGAQGSPAKIPVTLRRKRDD